MILLYRALQTSSINRNFIALNSFFKRVSPPPPSLSFSRYFDFVRENKVRCRVRNRSIGRLDRMEHSPKYPLPLDDLLGGGLGGSEQRVGQRRVPLRPPQHFGRDGGMMVAGWRCRALVADRRSGGRGTRAGCGGRLRMGHEQRGVLNALHVPDPRRRGGRGGRRRRVVGRLVHAQRGTPAPASLVAGPGAPQRAHPAVRPAVPISAPAAGHTSDTDRRWNTGEHTASRYTGPGLHFHEAGVIAASRRV